MASLLGTSGALLYLQYLRNRVKYLQINLVASGGTSGALLYLQYLRNRVNIYRKSCVISENYVEPIQLNPSMTTCCLGIYKDFKSP